MVIKLEQVGDGDTRELIVTAVTGSSVWVCRYPKELKVTQHSNGWCDHECYGTTRLDKRCGCKCHR